ncbi:MAG: bifunctional D-glycero-beta-D-manno-heptose-7-phosphate kinase/D-glycero-beta-D-manno-heptose 1-phosphate adenylyltransferase HldE [Gammaproteobacteria bacterium]|nr:bifunctional D-glycero-beta-D-manno-heptose-7-phosphate kinase/D-glycero-beta-D-manno-heptose 1-phosphate adenylyltransferase HldE [Gammaproteobacteria bacterium]
MTLTIPDFTTLKVLVAGDAMLDEYWFGSTERISPEAPVPVVRTQEVEQRPGGAANVALNLATLGAQVSLAACVGADARGQALTELLSADGVDCRFLESTDRPTIHKLRVLSRNQQLIRLDFEDSLADDGAAFADHFTSLAEASDIVVLSDYGKGTLSQIHALIACCRSNGKRVLVDPKGTDFQRYRGASLVTPNRSEFEAVVGTWRTEAEFEQLGQSLRETLELEALLVTRGEEGMTLFTDGETPVTLAAETREVFDVTGAGDTVIALMAAGLGCGLAPESAAALSNLGAGLVVGKIGVANLRPTELRLALHRRGRGGRGLVSAEELEGLIEQARARGERIVMTNGCFDILHAGHVAYLEEAKTLGDRLVVAVNDDASVARLKGQARPVNPLEDRMAVLSGLAAVDWVVPFSEDTPANVIGQLLPDVLVKGGDYVAEQIVGAKAVIANGGEVRVLAFLEGRSTTAVIDTLRGR